MMSAALAFYTILSLAPFLVVILTAAGYFLGDIRAPLLDQVSIFAGDRARTVVEIILENTEGRSFTASLSAVISGLIILYSSTAVFEHIRKSMNRIWGVDSGRGWSPLRVIRKRVLSLRMVALIGGAIVISILVGMTLEFILSRDNSLLDYAGNISSFIISVFVFAMIFKMLSDIVIRWRDALIGALATAILFEIGNIGISAYLRSSGVGSVYGAAGSMILFLVWIYYSSLIFFFGAELTHAYTCLYGSGATLPPGARRGDLCGGESDSHPVDP